MGLLYFIGVLIGLGMIAAIVEKLSEFAKARGNEKAKLYDELKSRIAEIDAAGIRVQEGMESLDILAREKSEGFPWLAKAYADFCRLQDLRRADYLEHKPHPAPIAADHVREIAAKRRVAEKLWRVLKYQLEYYESLFPWLVDFKGEDLDEIIRQVMEKASGSHVHEEEDADDPAKHWLTQAEYDALPTAEKFQRALVPC